MDLQAELRRVAGYDSSTSRRASEVIQKEFLELQEKVSRLASEVEFERAMSKAAVESITSRAAELVAARSDTAYWKAEAERHHRENGLLFQQNEDLRRHLGQPPRFREIVEKVLDTTSVESLVTLAQVEQLTNELVTALEADGVPSD